MLLYYTLCWAQNLRFSLSELFLYENEWKLVHFIVKFISDKKILQWVYCINKSDPKSQKFLIQIYYCLSVISFAEGNNTIFTTCGLCNFNTELLLMFVIIL